MTITTLASRDMDFYICTNRLSSNLKHMLLVGHCDCGSPDVDIPAVALRVIAYLGMHGQHPNGKFLSLTLGTYSIHIRHVFISCCSCRCILPVLMRIHRVFMIIIPAAVIFFLFCNFTGAPIEYCCNITLLPVRTLSRYLRSKRSPPLDCCFYVIVL